MLSALNLRFSHCKFILNTLIVPVVAFNYELKECDDENCLDASDTMEDFPDCFHAWIDILISFIDQKFSNFLLKFFVDSTVKATEAFDFLVKLFF